MVALLSVCDLPLEKVSWSPYTRFSSVAVCAFSEGAVLGFLCNGTELTVS